MATSSNLFLTPYTGTWLHVPLGDPTAVVVSDTTHTATTDTETTQPAARHFSLVVCLTNDIWRLILSYTLDVTIQHNVMHSHPHTMICDSDRVQVISSTARMVRMIDTGFRSVVDRMELDSLIDQVGPAEIVQTIAASLDPKEHQAQITSLQSWVTARQSLTAQRQSLLEGHDPLPLVRTAHKLRSDLIDTFTRIPESQLSSISIVTTSPHIRKFQHLSLIKARFEASVANGKDKEASFNISLDTAMFYEDLDNMPQQWAMNAIKNQQKRLSCCRSILDTYLKVKRDPDSALSLLQNEGRDLSRAQKMLRFGEAIDLLLKQERASTWDLLRLQAPPKVSKEEIQAADQFLAKAEDCLRNNKPSEACAIVRKELLAVDTVTGNLRFPNQCFAFLNMLSQPKQPLPMQREIIINARDLEKMNLSSIVSANTANPLNYKDPEIRDMLCDLIMLLPDDARKEEWLEKAKNENTFAANPEVSDIITTAWLEITLRPRRLYQLACIFFKERDFARGFQIVNTLNSPYLIFGCLDCLVKIENLNDDTIAKFLKLAENLPDVLKYILIKEMQANGQSVLEKGLEARFNRLAFRQQVEKEMCVVVRNTHAIDLILDKVAAKGKFDVEDIDRLHLLGWDLENINEILTQKFHDKFTVSDQLQTMLESFHSYKHLKIRTLITKKNTDEFTGLMTAVYKLPVFLQIGVLRYVKRQQELLKEQIKDKTDTNHIISTLQSELEQKEKGVIAKATEEHRKISIVSRENPILSAETVNGVIDADLLVLAFVRDHFGLTFSETPVATRVAVEGFGSPPSGSSTTFSKLPRNAEFEVVKLIVSDINKKGLVDLYTLNTWFFWYQKGFRIEKRSDRF